MAWSRSVLLLSTVAAVVAAATPAQKFDFVSAIHGRSDSTTLRLGSPDCKAHPVLSPTCNLTAPPSYSFTWVTTKGNVSVNVLRSNGPFGADRLFTLASQGYFSNFTTEGSGNANGFFRVVPNFVVQFGIAGLPAISGPWENAVIPNDPVVLSNVRGTLSYAAEQDGDGNAVNRTTQVYINFADNSRLDALGFTPIGTISETDMKIVDAIFAGYSELPDQDLIYERGDDYLLSDFPKLDFITASTVPVTPAVISAEVAAPWKKYLPPGNLNMGYVGGDCNTTQIVTAVESGLNVLFWFSINLVNRNGRPAVQGGPNLTCVAATAAELRARSLNTTHMISVGGWDAPHPTTAFTPQQVYAAWKTWNEQVVPRDGFPGFDGVDWDLEGNDNVTSPYNTFTVEVLDTVGVFSQLAQADGYIVSLVPPESYLDPLTAPLYDRSLLWAYPDGWQPNFKYHGHNAYAMLLAKYANTTFGSTVVPTFDLVMIQLYETYSHADYYITAATPRVTAAEYLVSWVPRVTKGWYLDFASDPASGVPSQSVNVPASRLVIGLANGWGGGPKTILMMPSEVGDAWSSLAAIGQAPRGCVFWTITSEGDVPTGQSQPLWMAKGLNQFLKTRPLSLEQ